MNGQEDRGAPPVPTARVEDVSRRFFRAGRLRTIPGKRKNRRAVLEVVAGRFELGRAYTECEVNGLLGAVYDDHCVLRRALVDEGLLLRTPSGSEYRSAQGDDLCPDVGRSSLQAPELTWTEGEEAGR